MGAVCPLPVMQTHTAKFIQTWLFWCPILAANAKSAHFHNAICPKAHLISLQNPALWLQTFEMTFPLFCVLRQDKNDGEEDLGKSRLCKVSLLSSHQSSSSADIHFSVIPLPLESCKVQEPGPGKTIPARIPPVSQLLGIMELCWRGEHWHSRTWLCDSLAVTREASVW